MTRSIRTTLTVAVLVSLIVAPAWADEQDEQSRMFRVAMAWFVSHNSGDAEAMKAFIAENRSAAALAERPVEQRVPGRMGMYKQIGELTSITFVREEENRIVFKAQSLKMNMWAECSFQFEAEEPHKLVQVMIRPTSAPGEEVADVGDWETATELAEKVAEQAKVPALAVAMVDGDEIVDVASVGVRAVGGDPVTVDDLWHIGSVTKSVTATAIAELVEMGKLDWDVTLGEALSDIEMRDEYNDVTLEDLLHHRGGIQPYTMLDAADEERLSKLTGNGTEIRAGFAREVLGKEPVSPGGEYHYSNAGYALAGLVAERASGMAWSDLVREYVFAAAGMERADFGWPATPERPDQPRGHFLEGDTLRVQALDEYPLGDYIDPAGDVCMSISDLARYARMHLRGLRGEDGTLGAATVAWLHTDPDENADTRYAAGWVIRNHPDLGEVHWHNGSAGTFYAAVAIFPEKNRAVVAASNGGLQRGQEAVERIIELLAESEK